MSNMCKVHNKDTRTTSLTLFWCLYCWFWTDLIYFLSFPLLTLNRKMPARCHSLMGKTILWVQSVSCQPIRPQGTISIPPENISFLTVFWCFQGVEEGCIGNEWVNKDSNRAMRNDMQKWICAKQEVTHLVRTKFCVRTKMDDLNQKGFTLMSLFTRSGFLTD